VPRRPAPPELSAKRAPVDHLPAPPPSAFIGVHLRQKFLHCLPACLAAKRAPRHPASKNFLPQMNADERG